MKIRQKCGLARSWRFTTIMDALCDVGTSILHTFFSSTILSSNFNAYHSNQRYLAANMGGGSEPLDTRHGQYVTHILEQHFHHKYFRILRACISVLTSSELTLLIRYIGGWGNLGNHQISLR